MEPLDLLGLVTLIGALVVVVGPIDDINDVFWHVLIGQQLLDGEAFSELGSTFSYSVDNPTWRTGAWTSEAFMAALYDTGGWVLLLSVMRLAPILGIGLVLWWGVVRRLPSRASVPTFVLTMATVATTVQERPQSWSLVAVALSGIWWFESVTYSRTPRWWVVGLLAAVWSNFHGLWVVLPAVMLLAIVGRALDHGRRDPGLRPLAVATAAAALGGLLTPLGLNGWLLPLRLQNAGGLIVEWQRTELLSWPGYALLISGGFCLVLLGRQMRRSWLVFVVGVGLFGLAAIRNVTPAVLLLAPVLAALITGWLGPRATTVVAPAERQRLVLAAGVLALIGALVTAGTIATRDHGPRDTLPTTALDDLRDTPGEIRLLNEYNWSGVALFYGPDRLTVGIDGRADYYGGDFIQRYEQGLAGMGLDELLTDLDPTHALLRPQTPAAQLLPTMGWTVIRETDEFVLLEGP